MGLCARAVATTVRAAQLRSQRHCDSPCAISLLSTLCAKQAVLARRPPEAQPRRAAAAVAAPMRRRGRARNKRDGRADARLQKACSTRGMPRLMRLGAAFEAAPGLRRARRRARRRVVLSCAAHAAAVSSERALAGLAGVDARRRVLPARGGEGGARARRSVALERARARRSSSRISSAWRLASAM